MWPLASSSSSGMPRTSASSTSDREERHMVDERTYEENHATVDINDEVKKSFLDYAMSVIVSRALPDVRDGMKPVQRRIVYSMFEAGMRPGTSFRKCSTGVGNGMGKHHPHGTFGTVDGPPAAMRYTESRLSPIAMHLMEGIREDTVDFQDNYSGESSEPVVLPARFPNLLANGATGIAVGMATNIPPHNLG